MKKLLTVSVILIFTLFSVQAQKAGNEKFFKDKYIKKAMTTALDWQLKNPKHNLYDWTNGAFYAGVFAAWETTGSKKIWKAMYEMGEANKWKPGPRLHHADDHVICQTYIDMYRVSGDKKMIQPFIETINKFMVTPYETGEIRPITWWWCDALFMAPPALVKLGVTMKENTYLELNDKLFKECNNLLYDKDFDLYARDMNYKWNEPGITPIKEANGEKIFWSRGNGWVMGGLVRVLKELPKDWPTRDFYLQNYNKT